MLILSIAFVVAFLAVLIIARCAHTLGGISLDHDVEGVQKIHTVAVPRIGGAGVFAAFSIAVGVKCILDPSGSAVCLGLLLCSIPAFLSGIIEDFTKRISARTRLIASMIAALAACYVVSATVTRVGVPFADDVLVYFPVAMLFTVFAVSGVVHSVNIIDGLNGLASVVAIVILTSIGLVAHWVGDNVIVTMAQAMVGAILGFLVWNYPVPKVFLGDGGAYFVGFYVAELLVLLTVRNPSLTPLYAILVVLYPVFETVFSIYRRKVLRGTPAGAPDGVHLHTLVFKRVVGKGRGLVGARANNSRNSLASPYLWLLNSAAVIPATLFYSDPAVIVVSIVGFIIAYVWLYSSIVRFRTPDWLRRT